MQITQALVVENRRDLRSGIQTALKTHGVQAVSFDKIGTLIKYMNQCTELPQLIISCPETENNSILTLLTLILRKKQFRNIVVALMYESAEDWYLPISFELGLISAHQKPLNQLKLEKEFGKLFELLKDPENGPTLTAYYYLRNFLMQKDHFDDLIDLEENLVKIYQKPTLFINLAESLYLAERYEDAKRTLVQAKFQHHSLNIAVKQLEDLFQEDFDSHVKTSDFSNAYNVGNCYIVDHDELSSNQIKESLIRLSIPKIEQFDDPENFLKAVQNEKDKLNLILIEWKFHSMNGVSLIQKISRLNLENYIIIVVSSLPGPEDKALLSELGISAHLSKPVQSESMTATLMSVIRGDRFPSDSNQLVSKFQKALNAKDLKEMKLVYNILCSNHKLSGPKLLALQAEIFLMENKVEEAKELLMSAVRSGEKDLLLFNLMGNVLLRLGDKKSALVCFDKACEFSPNNLARLCKMADICIDIGEKERTDTIIDSAKNIDSENDQVKSLEVKKSIVDQDLNQASSIIGEMESLSSLVSMMNNRAVLLAQSGQIADSIKTYIDTIKVIPKNKTEEKSKLFYNLALAFARQGNYKKSALILEKKLSNPSVIGLHEKSQSLLKRLKVAIQSGATVSFNFASGGPEITAFDSPRPVAMDLNPGDYQLHKIFHADSFIDKKVSDKLNFSKKFLGKKKAG